MAKHTPGPWRVIPPAHGHPAEYLCVELDVEELYSTGEMLPADAHLIAAAPDLLEVCKTLAEIVRVNFSFDGQSWEGIKGYQGEVDKARAAIAKAEGKEANT